MDKNTGNRYEKLTQKLYQQIVDLDTNGYEKIEVKHNVKIKGKSGLEHQIDVFWDFTLGSVHYSTIIEVKDWKNKVKKADLMAFTEKIKDIPGFPTGIYVSRSGFQSGALEWAQVHGIKLVTISEAETINHIHLTFNVRTPDITNFALDINYEWLKSYMDTNGIKGTFEFNAFAGDVVLCDNSDMGTPLISYIKEAQKPYLEKPQRIANEHVKYVFDDEKYLYTEDPIIPKVLINGFSFDLTINEGTYTHEIHPKNVADYILYDITEGKTTEFNYIHGIVNKTVGH